MSQRIRSLDTLRIFAVVLVVLQHAAIFLPAAQTLGETFRVFDRLASCDVQVLFLISGFLAGAHLKAIGPEAKRVVGRLLIPYAFWAVFYTSMFDVEAHIEHVQPRLPDIAGVLTGQGVYFILWFLPMLIYCSLLAALVRDRRNCLVASAASFVIWLALAFTLHGSTVPGYADSPIGFARQLPYFLALYLFAKWMGMADRERTHVAFQPVVTVFAIAVAANVASALWVSAPGLHAFHVAIDLVFSAGLGLALLLFALKTPNAGDWLPSFWADSAPFSIYLTHMLVLTAIAHFLPLIGTPWPEHVIALALAGVLGASLLAGSVLRVPLLRPVFGHPVSSHR